MRDRPMRATFRDGRANWYRIVNHQDRSAADVFIYDEVGYYGVTAHQFVQDISDLQVATINLRINSPGGEVFDGVAIYNALKNHKAAVQVTVDGLAASAASFIAMAGNKITMRRGSQMMIHEAAGLCIGNSADMRDLADNLDRVSGTIASFYAERAGGTVDEWRDRMRAETWFTGEEAVAAGLADEFEDPASAAADAAPEAAIAAVDDTAPIVAATDEVPQHTWDLSIFTYAGRDHAPPPTVAPPPEPAPPTTEQPTNTEGPVTDDGAFAFDPDAFRNAVRAAYPKKEAVS